MEVQEVEQIFQRPPPVPFVLELSVLGQRRRTVSLQRFFLAQDGEITSEDHDRQDVEKLKISIGQDVLQEIHQHGDQRLLEFAQDDGFVIEGDFRIFMKYINECIAVIKKMGDEVANRG